MKDQKKYYISEEFYQQLEEKFNGLLEKREQVVEEIVIAKSNGDLSENADYDAARDLQGRIEYEINSIKQIRENHEIIVPKTYTYQLDSGKTKVVTIVDSVEANLFQGGESKRISYDCALGQALDGAQAGEEVDVYDEDDNYLYSVTVKEVK